MSIPFRPGPYYGDLEDILSISKYGGVVVATDRGFAVKMMLTDDGLIPGPLLQEIVSLLKVNSPYVIPLVDVVLSDDMLGLILPLAGKNLSRAMGDPTLDVKSIMRQLCLGVADIHNANLLHLDLKPQNLFLHNLPTSGGYTNAQLWVADLDVSRINTCALPPLPGDFFTLYYRPPEIILGGPVTPKADVWAIGVILTELLISRNTGRYNALFPGETEIEELDEIFKLLGTPTSGVLTTLPKWKNDFAIWERKLRSYLYTYHLSDEEINLIEYILNLDYNQRPSVFDILQHPWLSPVQVPPQLTCLESLDIYSHYPPNNWPDQSIRIQLVEWMGKVIDSLMNSFQSLSLAVYLIDRMMSIQVIPSEKLELFASAALYIGIQLYDHIIEPDKFVSISKGISDLKDLRDTINLILKTTSFDLAATTSYLYLSRYLLTEPLVMKYARHIWRGSLYTPSHFLHPSITATAIATLADTSKALTDEAKQLYDQIMTLPENLIIMTGMKAKDLQNMLRAELS